MLGNLDESIVKRGFTNRSEALRQAIRSFLAEYRSLDEIEGEVVATISTVYRRAGKDGRMLSIQHRHEGLILTFLHTHVDEKNCLEVMVVRGSTHDIRELVHAMKANEQVQQVKVGIIRILRRD